MQNKQTKIEHNIPSLFAQLQIGTIEGLLRKALAECGSSDSTNKRDEISTLLNRLNEDCMLPVVHFERLTILSLKQEAGELTPQELEELSALKKEEKKLQLKRIGVIKKLAVIKRISLEELAQELG